MRLPLKSSPTSVSQWNVGSGEGAESKEPDKCQVPKLGFNTTGNQIEG